MSRMQEEEEINNNGRKSNGRRLNVLSLRIIRRRGFLFAAVIVGLCLLLILEENNGRKGWRSTRMFVMVDAAACGSCLASSVVASHHYHNRWKNGSNPQAVRWIVTTCSTKTNGWFHPAILWHQLLSSSSSSLKQLSSSSRASQLCQYVVLLTFSKSPWWNKHLIPSITKTRNRNQHLSLTSLSLSQSHYSTHKRNINPTASFILSSAQNDDKSLVEKEENNNITDDDDDDKDDGKNVVSVGMVTTIGIYKNYISPLLPPACRFVPTCSQYGVQAIEQFGPTKGVILTAWRLLRCSPFGGKGYDPPKWPPVAYNYASW